MTVGKLIELLRKKYNDDDELYFTTSAIESEFVFDNVEVEDKDCQDEGCIYLTFTKKHKRDFTNAIVYEWKEEFREDLNEVLNKYL